MLKQFRLRFIIHLAIYLSCFVIFSKQSEILAIEYKKELLVSDSIKNLSKKELVQKLYNQAFEKYRSGEYRESINLYQKALAIYREIKDLRGESQVINDLAGIYLRLNKNIESLDLNKQSLNIRRQIRYELGELQSLISLGATYNKLSQYSLALDSFNQAIVLAQKVGTERQKASLYSNLGQVFANLGQFPKSYVYYEQALKIRRQINDSSGIANTLHNLGFTYEKLSRYNDALKVYEESLAIRRLIKDRLGEAKVLNNIGSVLSQQRKYTESVKALESSLKIFRDIQEYYSAGLLMDSLANAYQNLGKYDLAQSFYFDALAIKSSSKQKGEVAITLSNLGDLYAKQGNISTAIAFYKESIQVIESIRKELTTLDIEQQKSYTNTVAYTYRALADLLLSQGRVLEAQQVLELLKIQEIRDFTKNNRTGDNAELTKNNKEAQVIDAANSLIKLGLDIDKCEKEKCTQKYLEALKDQRLQLTKKFHATIDSFKEEAKERASRDDGFFKPEKIQGKAGDILSAQPNTILIYTFVQTDRTWIIWAAKGGIKKPIEIKAGRSQIGKFVLDLRTQLGSPNTDIAKLKETSKQLHDIIIPPELQAELKANKIENLVFSLDSVTRYIPMSVLFDGKQYLLEKYAISNLISADLIDVKDRLPSDTQNIKVIAAGVSQKFEDFAPLLNVPTELDAIVKSSQSGSGIFAGKRLLNAEFTSKTLRNNLSGYNILHIATHGKFVPVDANASFLLLGDGTKLIIKDIKNAIDDLYQVHLVVLSACETALGEEGQDGVEISGLSYYFLNGGAKAVIASLWSVNDDSTSQLMKRFYANLAKGTAQAQMSKIEALRQAQLGLLRSDESSQESDQRGNFVSVEPRLLGNVQPAKKNNFAHPYYWAPFILIGNGL